MTVLWRVQVKKWMRRFIQTEGPSTVYTPPPGKSPEDPVQGTSRHSRTAVSSSQRQGPRDDSIVRQSDAKRTPIAQASRANVASGATTVSDVDSPDSADVSHPAGVQQEGGAASLRQGTSNAHAGPMAESSAAGAQAGAGSVAEGTEKLNGSDTVAGAEGGGMGTLGELQKPMRTRSQSIGRRVARPRRRSGAAQAGREGSLAAADSSGGSATPDQGNGWRGEWGNGGPTELLDEAGADLKWQGGPVPAAVGQQNEQKSGSRNGDSRGSRADASPERGSVSIADAAGSEPAIR